MLERYFARPRTWDRIRGSWIGPAIEKYVDWLEERHCAQRTICYRVPVLEQFGQFAKASGASTWSDLPRYVDPFVKHRIRERGGRHPSECARRRLRHATQIPVEQMLRLTVPGFRGARRENMPLPLLREVPGFFPFLHDERGLRPGSVRHYAHYLRSFERYLARIGLTSLADLTPLVLTGFVTESAKTLAPYSMGNLVTTLRTLLRFIHREGMIDADLSATVERPLIYQDAKLPRSITWAEVRRVLAAVDRRTAIGKRDYAILMLLVSYGLRANEISHLTLDNIDWRQGRVRILERKAGNSTSYPISDAVGDAVAAYLKDGRPSTNHRQVFLGTQPPFPPATISVVYQCAKRYLRAAGVSVRRPGSHTFRHTCVQRLVDVGMPLPAIGDYVGHRSPKSTRVYGKVAVETLREVALGDGEDVLR
ncbi:MAG: site-specific integrase [Polyangiaceae bacterium]